MRLADRILRGWFDVAHRDADLMQGKKKTLEAMREAYCCDVQNVSDWLIGKKVSLDELCPIAKPPFPVTWMEYKCHEDDNNPESRVYFEAGALIGELSDGFNLLVFGRDVQDDKRAQSASGLIVKTNDEFEIAKVEVYAPREVLAEGQTMDDFGQTISNLMRPMFAAITFFHCKNVSVKTVKRSPKLEKQFKKQTGEQQPSFHFIEVHRSSVRTINENAIAQAKIDKRASMIRGHFKRFEDGKGLFGRHHGMYFWEPHIRGTGPVEKSDYRVWGPKPEHERKCLIVQGRDRDIEIKKKGVEQD